VAVLLRARVVPLALLKEVRHGQRRFAALALPALLSVSARLLLALVDAQLCICCPMRG
jgi:hypothetical protein